MWYFTISLISLIDITADANIYISFLYIFPPPTFSPNLSPHIPGEVCQSGYRCRSVLIAQRMPGSAYQQSEHQRRSLGHVAQHPPRPAGEQHGPKRGIEFKIYTTVCTTPKCILFVLLQSQNYMNNLLVWTVYYLSLYTSAVTCFIWPQCLHWLSIQLLNIIRQGKFNFLLIYH